MPRQPLLPLEVCAIRVIAVDWSGAAEGAERKIWLAEARDGELRRLESGRTRPELVGHLAEEADRDPELVVGLDFAFSLPAWFLDDRGLEDARELWELVEREGERWLEDPRPPFWGRPGTSKPELPEHFRKTERELPDVAGIGPKSPFQVGGAGAVGTASLRGMPHLLELSRSGFSVWPFEDPSLPLVVEIYPRSLTGEVVKSDEEARARYLDRNYPGLDANGREPAVHSDDAFDAAVSALVMARHVEELRSLATPSDPLLRREGLIWSPGRPSVAPGRGAASAKTSAGANPARAEDLGRRFGKALVFAHEFHREQRRKGSGVPYVAHLLGVCSLTLEAGGDEDQAIAALLHDAAEDQGGRATLEIIRERFGNRVADIVEACSDTLEDPKPPWRPRKEAYLSGLAEEPADALLVTCADKLYNARAILRDHRTHGDDVFDRFKASREETLWYYGSLVEGFRGSELESWLVDELERVVEELEERAASGEGGA